MTRTRLRALALLTTVLVAGACDVDGLLEGDGDDKPVAFILALQSTSLSMAPGDSATLVATATRLDDSKGKLTFEVTLPPGFSATIVSVVEVGTVTTATITVRAGASVVHSTYSATIRATGQPSGVRVAQVSLKVEPRPGIVITPVQTTVTIIPGGIAPLHVTVARTRVTDPVTLTLVGPAGIAFATPVAPLAGSDATVTLAVGTAVAPGTYEVTLRASAADVPDDDAAISIVVSPDPLQLILDDVSAVQATLVSPEVILNRNGVAGAVTLSVEGLPAGVTFSADPVGGTVASFELAVAATAPPGNHQVTLRATDGSQGTTTAFRLIIAPSDVDIVLGPQGVALLPGNGAVSVLTVVRTSFEGVVAVEVLDVPPGISVSVGDPTVSGTTTALVVSSEASVTPGAYELTVRASPQPVTGGPGGPTLEPVSAPLSVTVVAAPSGANVTLDWSRCITPAWVAGRDATGPWTQLAGGSGLFGMLVGAFGGGIAYSTGPNSLTVKFATTAELTGAPVDMCAGIAPSVPLETVTGTTDFGTVLTSASYTWNLGGGLGTSTLTSPGFTISGVRPGIHDLVGIGTVGAGRGPFVLMRDVNPAAATHIGTVPISGEFAVPLINGNARIVSLAAERVNLLESFLTTAACSSTGFFSTGTALASTGSLTFTLLAIPLVRLRATDYHRVEATATSSEGTRSASLSLHAFPTFPAGTARDVLLPPQLPAHTVTTLPGSHRRVRLSFDALPTGYGGDLSVQFGDGQATATIVVTGAALAAFGGGPVEVDMPDLGGTGGFPTALVPAAAAHGTWSVRLVGSNGPTDCAEGASRWSIVRNGVF